jgi:hypothetical protein
VVSALKIIHIMYDEEKEFGEEEAEKEENLDELGMRIEGEEEDEDEPLKGVEEEDEEELI